MEYMDMEDLVISQCILVGETAEKKRVAIVTVYAETELNPPEIMERIREGLSERS